MSGIGQETLSNFWKWSGDAPKCEGVVAGPPRSPGAVGRPSQISGSGRETLPNVREWWQALPDLRERLGGPLGCPGLVWRPSGMFGSIERPSRMSGIGRETHSDFRKWSGDAPKCEGVVGGPPRCP